MYGTLSHMETLRRILPTARGYLTVRPLPALRPKVLWMLLIVIRTWRIWGIATPQYRRKKLRLQHYHAAIPHCNLSFDNLRHISIYSSNVEQRNRSFHHVSPCLKIQIAFQSTWSIVIKMFDVVDTSSPVTDLGMAQIHWSPSISWFPTKYQWWCGSFGQYAVHSVYSHWFRQTFLIFHLMLAEFNEKKIWRTCCGWDRVVKVICHYCHYPFCVSQSKWIDGTNVKQSERWGRRALPWLLEKPKHVSLDWPESLFYWICFEYFWIKLTQSAIDLSWGEAVGRAWQHIQKFKTSETNEDFGFVCSLYGPTRVSTFGSQIYSVNRCSVSVTWCTPKACWKGLLWRLDSQKTCSSLREMLSLLGVLGHTVNISKDVRQLLSPYRRHMKFRQTIQWPKNWMWSSCQLCSDSDRHLECQRCRRTPCAPAQRKISESCGRSKTRETKDTILPSMEEIKVNKENSHGRSTATKARKNKTWSKKNRKKTGKAAKAPVELKSKDSDSKAPKASYIEILKGDSATSSPGADCEGTSFVDAVSPFLHRTGTGPEFHSNVAYHKP